MCFVLAALLLSTVSAASFVPLTRTELEASLPTAFELSSHELRSWIEHVGPVFGVHAVVNPDLLDKFGGHKFMQLIKETRRQGQETPGKFREEEYKLSVKAGRLQASLSNHASPLPTADDTVATPTTTMGKVKLFGPRRQKTLERRVNGIKLPLCSDEVDGYPSTGGDCNTMRQDIIDGNMITYGIDDFTTKCWLSNTNVCNTTGVTDMSSPTCFKHQVTHTLGGLGMGFVNTDPATGYQATSTKTKAALQHMGFCEAEGQLNGNGPWYCDMTAILYNDFQVDHCTDIIPCVANGTFTAPCYGNVPSCPILHKMDDPNIRQFGTIDSVASMAFFGLYPVFPATDDPNVLNCNRVVVAGATGVWAPMASPEACLMICVNSNYVPIWTIFQSFAGNNGKCLCKHPSIVSGVITCA